MTDVATIDTYGDTYGEVIEPATLKIQRLLPGPIKRVWAYLTENDLRRKWLASGEMDLRPGAPFELTWRNDELDDSPTRRPEGFPKEHRMQSEIIEVDPPHRLVFSWMGGGEVSIALEEQGNKVLLTLIHRRISDRTNMLMVGAGWHMHLDILVARVKGNESAPFWEGWLRLKDDYDRLIPA
ncbi:SRPBCC family protein [Microbaculum marinum]|uniref:SRPBCC family protein n=1 Tax=Microbaculum marinum TaxID=1764581 RepID=A0AAW9RL55_9HYPH